MTIKELELQRRIDRLESEIEKTIAAHKAGEDLGSRFRTLDKLVHSYRSFWTPETIIAKVHDWNEMYGRPPAAADWNPAAAKRQGSRQEIIDRFLEGDWPQVSTCMRHFVSWNAMIVAAGFQGRTGPDEQSLSPGGNADHLPIWDGWEHMLHLRERAGMRQQDAAEKSGLSMTYYSMLENGRQRNPSVRVLLAVANGLDVQPAVLL